MSLSAPAIASVCAEHPSGAAYALLDDGRRHFQHGPIDLIVGADGSPDAIEAAVSAAWHRFTQILPELVAELACLRSPARPGATMHGPVAARMQAACEPYALQTFLTPMAAVAGSVAQELVSFFAGQPGIERAYVNNGGDIALHLAPGSCFRVGLFSDLGRFAGGAPELDGAFAISADMPVRGIATSGWRGRSFSMGIADSVTVLAADAAGADVAATLIANQVYVDHQAVVRAPADTLKDDTDLGSRRVTVQVGPLPKAAIDTALERGAAFAQRLCDEGLIQGAVLMLQGSVRTVGIVSGQGEPLLAAQHDFKAIETRASLRNVQLKESHV